MKLRKLKKGFTLVELVVVIAIIAILSGVSVAVYSSITGKAKATADSEIVSQLNTQLKSKKILEGRNNTAYEAYLDAKEIGFDLNLMTPSSGKDCNYIWDQKNDLFAITKGQEVIAKDKDSELPTGNETYKQWIFTSNPSTDESRSQYYTGNLTVDTALTISTGFDVGQGSYTTLTYQAGATDPVKDDVVIRSNGGSLTVDAAKDTVQHYGELAFLNIKAVATSSYHEFGYTAQGQINTGRVVIEDAKVEKSDGSIVDAAIDGLFLVAKTEEATTATGSFDTIIIETKGDADMPTLDRSQVTINETTGTKVCEVKTPSEDNDIWLTKNGIYENVTVTNPDATTAGTTAPTENTDTAQAGWEIANAAKRNDQGQLIDSDGNVTTDTTKAVVEEKASQEDLDKGTTLFAGGAGTEVNPYLISNATEFININEMSDKFCYFRQIDDFSYNMGCYKAYINNNVFNGSYDGGNHYINADALNTTGVLALFFYSGENAIFNDLNIYCKNHILCFFYDDFDNCNHHYEFNGINIYSDGVLNSTSQNACFFLRFCDLANGKTNGDISFKNCNIYASIFTSAADSSAFIGSCILSQYTYRYTLSFEDCSIYGSYESATSCGALVSHLYSNYINETELVEGDSSISDVLVNLVTIKNLNNLSTVIGGKNAALFADGNDDTNRYGYIGALNSKFKSIDEGTYTIKKERSEDFKVYYQSGTFNVETDNTSDSFKVVLTLGCMNWIDSEGEERVSNTSLATIDASKGSEGLLLNGSVIHAYDYDTAVNKGVISSGQSLKLDYTCNGYKFALIQSNDSLIAVFEKNSKISSVDSTFSITIYAYNSNGEPVGYKNIK